MMYKSSLTKRYGECPLNPTGRIRKLGNVDGRGNFVFGRSNGVNALVTSRR